MEYAGLHELIRNLQYGTKLHIGVISVGSLTNHKLSLPEFHKIHSAEVCKRVKESDGRFKNCFACRNKAIDRIIREKRELNGLCVYGVYEYMRPVIIDGNVAFIIFIGNILTPEGMEKLRKINETLPLDTMETTVDVVKCRELALLMEGYIHLLLEKYKAVNGKAIVNNIKDYIAENIGYDFSVKEMAAQLNYSEVYLGKIFKKETGTTIKEYINKRRIQNALKLLLEDVSIMDASQRVGYNNVTYFNRVFKKEMGMTPSEYKYQHTND